MKQSNEQFPCKLK